MNVRFINSRNDARIKNLAVLPEDLKDTLSLRVYEREYHPEGCMRNYKRTHNGDIPTYELVKETFSRVKVWAH